MGLFRKKEVPAELPSLAIDSLKANLAPSTAQSITETKEQVPLRPLPVVQQTQAQVQNVKNAVLANEEDGYFKNLVKSITEETEDLDRLSSWYKNKFLPGDMVFQMREYWQKQQPEILLRNVSGELKNKLMVKTEKLHSLEKEWQEIYFTLLSKEEEIRKEEKELKDSLAEFIEMLKRTIGDKKQS